tara:strand:+ start:189 stop:359 length:171 start_codon:yes stop_codon:yes gene_type:complete
MTAGGKYAQNGGAASSTQGKTTEITHFEVILQQIRQKFEDCGLASIPFERAAQIRH